MTHVKQISITLSRTINLGNYESKRAEVTETFEILEGEYYSPKAMTEEVKSSLNTALDAIE